jgi:hypothetical protein
MLRMTIELEETVTIADTEGRPAWRLRTDGDTVRLEAARVSVKTPQIRLDDLRQAVERLVQSRAG